MGLFQGTNMELIFVRHAQPEWVQGNRSVLDPVLTEKGIAQAKHLGEAAKAWKPPTAFWVSPTRRTQATAAPLIELFGPATTLAFLEEMRLPRHWDGAPADSISSIFADSRSRSLDEWHAGFTGGERYADFEARICIGLAGVLEGLGVRRREVPGGLFEIENANQRLLIVGHGGTNAVALSWLLGLPGVPWAWERFVQAHSAVTRVKSTGIHDGHVFGLRQHSDVSHLPPGLRSR